MPERQPGDGTAVSVHAALRSRDGGDIPQADWIPDLEHLVADGRLDPGFLLLRLTLTGSDGSELVVLDDFGPTVQNLCLRLVPVVAAGEAYVYEYWAHQGGLRFTPEEDRVRVTGVAPVEVEPTTFARAALSVELLAFARTAIDFMVTFAAIDQRYDSGGVPHLEDLYATAEAAVAESG